MSDSIEPKAKRLEALDNKKSKVAINQNYSRSIKKLQIILPIIAIILIMITFGWGQFDQNKITPINEEDIQPEIRQKLGQQEIGKNELVNPTFESVDTKNQPFTITALKAIQDDTKNGEMFLEEPKGALELNNGSTVNIQSKTGLYQQVQQFLKLNENVILTHSDGYEMKTDQLSVDLNENKAWSDKPVQLESVKGSGHGSGIIASSNEDHIILKGPARLDIHMEESNNPFQKVIP